MKKIILIMVMITFTSQNVWASNIKMNAFDSQMFLAEQIKKEKKLQRQFVKREGAEGFGFPVLLALFPGLGFGHFVQGRIWAGLGFMALTSIAVPTLIQMSMPRGEADGSMSSGSPAVSLSLFAALKYWEISSVYNYKVNKVIEVTGREEASSKLSLFPYLSKSHDQKNMGLKLSYSY